jgi:hypothetical protein
MLFQLHKNGFVWVYVFFLERTEGQKERRQISEQKQTAFNESNAGLQANSDKSQN